MRFAKRFTTLISILLLLAGFLVSVNSKPATAATGSDWRAGNIIDDSLFYNGNDMSAAEIQQFLNARVPQCDTWGTKIYSGSQTRAQYGASRGYPAPYTCLKDYSQSIPGYGADAYCGAIGGGVKSAAQIIKDVSQACGIGSKVLIVLLQKEQSLITDDWPWSSQYQKATGFACPDTAPCDSQYAGYFNQVYRAARQYKLYRANPGSYRYKARQNNAIQYNPNIGCGSSNVYIENDATAGLYIYTPYQPNQAALNNMYGTGDGCSAYGNRNFWRMYTDWFGATRGSAYSWNVTSQYAFTDNTKSTPASLENLKPGDRRYVGITIVNNGTATWYNSGANPVNLGTGRPNGRASAFADSGWLGPNRPATMQQSSVAPGQTATFEFWMKAPSTASGNIREYFVPVVEGREWMADIGMYFNTNTQAPNYSWQLISQFAYTDQTMSTGRSLINMEPGERVYVDMKIRNSGNVTWSNSGSNPLHLGISRPFDRYSYFFDSSWVGQNRPSRMKESTVLPGGTATFEFYMTVPNRPGEFYEYFTPVVEGVTWMTDIGLNYYGTIKRPVHTYSLLSQYAYTDSSKTSAIGLSSLARNSTVFVGFTVRNTGNVTWYKTGSNPVHVGTSRPYGRLSPFFSNSWLGQNRPAQMKEASVAPGQVATFEFNYTAPGQPGTYLEYFSLVVEGREWMTDIGLNFNSRVL
jgi:hypothetical protein